jgi:hypothetical protein
MFPRIIFTDLVRQLLVVKMMRGTAGNEKIKLQVTQPRKLLSKCLICHLTSFVSHEEQFVAEPKKSKDWVAIESQHQAPIPGIKSQHQAPIPSLKPQPQAPTPMVSASDCFIFFHCLFHHDILTHNV